MDIAQLGLSVRSDGVIVATNRLKKMERQSGRTDSAIMRMAKNMKAAFVGVALGAAAMFGGQALFGTIASFETSMAAVGAITRASTDDLKAMREVAKELGATTEYTASQAADALKFLGMAGFTSAQSIAAIPAVLDLATAAQMDLARAADISSNIMSAFGISADRASEATDVLAAIASRANTDVEQLGDGMKYVGPVASALNISINDTAAAMGALAQAGIQGSMGGTSLRRVLSSLANPTKDAAKVLASLGVSMEDVNPATNDIVDIIDRLAESGLDAADALTIFGDRGGPAILALTSQREFLRDLTGTMKDVTGESKRMADTMRDQLGGDAKGLQSALEGLIIQLGESGLTSILRGLIQGLTTFVRAITGAIKVVTDIVIEFDAWIGVSDTISRVMEQVGLKVDDFRGFVLAAAGMIAAYYLPSIISATVATGTFIASLVTLRGALMATGIGAIVVAAGLAINKLLQLTEAVGGFGNAMVYVKELGLEVWDRMKIGAGALWEYMRAFGAGYVLLWRQTFATVLNLFSGFIDKMLDGTRNAMLATGNLGAAAAIEASRATIKAAMKDAADAANANVAAQQAIMDEHKNTADQMVQDAIRPLYMWQALTDVIDAAQQKAANANAAGTVPTVPVVPTDGTGGGGGAANDNTDASQQFITSLQDELLQLTLTEEAYRRLQVEKAAAMAPTPEMAEQIRLLGEMREITLAQLDAEAMSEEQRVNALQRFQALGDSLRGNIENPALRLQAQYEEQLRIVDKYEQAYTDKTAEANAARLEIERQYQDAKLRLTLSSGEQAAGALAGAFGQMLGEQSGAYKAMFAIQQAFVIATASLNIAKAMSEALALPFPANLAAWGVVASNAAQIMTAINSVALGFAEGGYTGAGGKYDVAGVVHKGEVVWSQQDVARYGGWQNVDAMRRGIMPANDNGGGRQSVELKIMVSVDDDGKLQAYVARGMNEAVNASVTIADQRTKARIEQAEGDASRPVISARKVA